MLGERGVVEIVLLMTAVTSGHPVIRLESLMNNSRPSGRRRPLTIMFFTVLLVLGICVGGMALLSWTAVRPTNIGVRNGRLALCPDAPNGVSTQAEDHEHWIAPLTIPSDSAPPIELLAGIVRRLPRTSIVQQSDDYLYVEFRSRIFHFCDDVELFVEPETKRVHFRSASRVGRSDLGVNRDRMELIRGLFDEAARTHEALSPNAGFARPVPPRVIALTE